MAEMLTYYDSKSKEYIWRTTREIKFSDENFAREVMQLFTIGLHKLNMDGTYKLNDGSNKVLTYTNNEIEEYARVWTGFSKCIWQFYQRHEKLNVLFLTSRRTLSYDTSLL